MNEFITKRFTKTDSTDLEPIHHEPPTLEQSLAWLQSQGECAVIALAHFNDQVASLQREKVIAKEINDALMDKNQKLEKEIKSVYDSYHNNIVAMQCCVIETEHNGHEAGFSWIWNTLCGPGLIPEPDEEWYESAQLYYSANISEPFGPCGICGKPSNTSAAHGVSCCEEHNEQLRTNKAGAQ
jgi:hypothetical protein